MKKAILALYILATLTACSDIDEPKTTIVYEDNAVSVSTARSPKEACAYATQAFSDFYGSSRAIVRIKNVRTFCSERLSRTGTSDTLYYVVNLDGNAGYAVISANREITPILAITESGNIENIDSIDNPGAAMFFDCADIALSNKFSIRDDLKVDSLSIIKPNPWWPGSGDNGENPLPVTQYKDDVKYEDHIVEPRVPLCWGQNFPEGLYYDNGVAGCGTTATLLLMSHFRKQHKLSNMRFKDLSIDWDLILTHRQSRFQHDILSYPVPLSDPAQEMLAELSYEIGILNKSEYVDDYTTGTSIENSYNAMIKIKTDGFVPKPIQSGMPNGYLDLTDGIIYVRGSKANGIGHAFIIDGYKHRTTICSTYKREPGEVCWTLVSSKSYTAYNYNHINWGLEGSDNGYFNVGVFDLNNGYEYDRGKEESGNDRNYIKDFRYFVVTK